MAQAKALDALAPFIALSKAANSPRQAADVVARATSHPNTFIFAELLQTPQIQALGTADPEYAAYLTLLRIFSYGTYIDYESGTAPSSQSPSSQPPTQPPQTQSPATQSALPALNEAQTTKLRQLSLMSFATDRASLGYDHLVRKLRLGDSSSNDTDSGKASAIRQLETLVISAVYAGLITATLDPALKVVRISSVAPLRDLAPGAVPRLHAALSSWSHRCETTLADIDAQIAGIRAAAASHVDEEQRWNAQFKRAIEIEKQAMLGKGNGGGADKRTMTLNVSNSSTDPKASAATSSYNSRGAGSAGSSQRFHKQRGSNTDVLEEFADNDDDDDDDDDDEAMDLDDDAGEGNKRNRRRA